MRSNSEATRAAWLNPETRARIISGMKSWYDDPLNYVLWHDKYLAAHPRRHDAEQKNKARRAWAKKRRRDENVWLKWLIACWGKV